jgi:hypothetical protein
MGVSRMAEEEKRTCERIKSDRLVFEKHEKEKEER